MATVISALSVSVDGFIAGANDGPALPLGDGGTRLFDWYSGGEEPSRYYPRFTLTPQSRDVFDERCARNGAVVSGRRTYDIASGWNGDGPQVGIPLFVLTHQPPKNVPDGPIPYTFVSDGIQSAITKASEAAGDRAVSLMGSAAVQQALAVGLLDELHLDVAPVLLGSGVRLLDHLGATPPDLELLRVVDSPGVTHLSYRVAR